MSNLPQALQRQLEEAEAIEKALTGANEETTEEVVETTEEVTEQTQSTESESQPEAQNTEAPSQLKAKPGREEDAAYWQQRAQTMYGINQSQSQQLHELRNQVSQLTSEIAKLNEQKAAPQPSNESLVTDKDVETFGSDLIDLQERVAKKAIAEARGQFQAVIDQQAEYIKQLEGKLGVVDQQVSASTQDRFYEALAKAVPEWEQINVDQRFLVWLGETDQMTGVTRQAYLDDAANRMDLARVTAIFNAFKQAVGAVATEKTEQVNKAAEKKSELERQVAPGKSKASAPAESGKRIWTRAEYERAYDPRYTKHLSADQAAQLEAEADLAVAEGRVQF